jgi:nucleoside-diphosphate-sugar epimerase
MPTNKPNIDKSNPVLVTGATGYLAGILIKHLLDEGLTVHATVRDPSKKERLQYLQDVADKTTGTLKFFQGDLNTNGSFADGMKGCSVVFHTASPASFAPTDPYKDLVEPAVQGTENVLNTASETATVKRVVLTSSTFAVYTDAIDKYEAPNQVFNEEVWNRTASLTHQPYALSKTLAEQKAWVIAGSQTQWKLVVVNPGLVMGPGLKYSSSSESFKLLKDMADGSMKYGAPSFPFAIVDIRDVADAHMAAAWVDNAKGRYIIVGENVLLPELGKAIAAKYPDYSLPTSALPAPRAMLYVIAQLGMVEGLTPKMAWNNANDTVALDNTKSKRELGIEYRPMEPTLQEMFKQMIDEGIVMSSKK